VQGRAMARHATACSAHRVAENPRGPTQATRGVLAAMAAMAATAAAACTAPYTCGRRRCSGGGWVAWGDKWIGK
jgi:hypothetical protein